MNSVGMEREYFAALPYRYERPCVILCCTTLCYAIRHYTVLHYITLYTAMHYIKINSRKDLMDPPVCLCIDTSSLGVCRQRLLDLVMIEYRSPYSNLSTVAYSVVQHLAVQHSTAERSKAQYSEV